MNENCRDKAPSVRSGRSAASLGVRVVCRIDSWIAVDWAVALYATFVAILAVVRASAIPKWTHILAAHTLLVAALVWLPPRGAAWERPDRGDERLAAWARAAARFLRYTYPALLLTAFFEEVALTVNAIAPASPYWFEPHLYAIDRAIVGATPAVLSSQAGFPILDEIMHAFYFSYYLLITCGIVIAWTGGGRGRATPAPGFHAAMTTMMLGFFLSYVWYPFLPARGPWENPELMAELRPFDGWFFTGAVKLMMTGVAVSGGCFPSAHVSGTWALTFGLFPWHRRAALWLGMAAVGLSVACVYTRYHHLVDVLAGVAVAAIAVVIVHWSPWDRWLAPNDAGTRRSNCTKIASA